MAGVLLIGNLRSSLTLARQLSRAGHEVHCGIDEIDPYLHTSRHVRGSFVHAAIDRDPARTLDQVDAYLAEHAAIEAVIPVSEIAARLFSRHRDRFAAVARVIAPTEAVLETCIDKPLMFDLCDEVGLPVAPRRLPTDHPSLMAAIDEIGFPCIVKPADAGHFLFERKAIVLKTRAEAEAALPYWPVEHARLCVQKFVDAPRHILMFAAKDGEILGAVDARVTRTDLADGTGFTTDMVSDRVHPVVAEGLARLVRRLDYTGVGDVDIMVDEASGEISFLELNPRLGASYKSAEICGLPLSRLILALGMGEEPPPCPSPWTHPVGRRLVWTKAEVGALKRDLKSGALARSALPARLGRMLGSALAWHHMTFDLLDPLPTVWCYLHPVLRRFGFGKAVHAAVERERERFAGYEGGVRQQAGAQARPKVVALSPG